MDFSWSEMLLVGIVALIVIGPKDLPGMFRELGRITAKIRAMGREFSRAMEQAAKETGVKDAATGLKAMSNPAGAGLDAVKSAADRFEKWDPLKSSTPAAKPLTPPPMPATPAAVAAAPAAVAEAAVAEAAPVTEVDPAKLGPATAALYEQKAARKAAAAAAAKAAPMVAEAAAEPAAAAAKAPGRRRKTPDAEGGEQA